MKLSDPFDPNAKLYFGPLTPEQLAAVLAKAKAEFTAADLQRFTEEEEGIPLDEVIKELEESHRQATQRSE